MIVDTSAMVAIIRDDPDTKRLLQIVRGHPSPRISAGNLLELSMVIDGARNPALSAELDRIIITLGVITEPVTFEQVTIARDAFRRYGKGSGHGARLNYGDCFAYALARERGEPLLFIGNDFAQTDIEPAT